MWANFYLSVIQPSNTVRELFSVAEMQTGCKLPPFQDHDDLPQSEEWSLGLFKA